MSQHARITLIGVLVLLGALFTGQHPATVSNVSVLGSTLPGESPQDVAIDASGNVYTANTDTDNTAELDAGVAGLHFLIGGGQVVHVLHKIEGGEPAGRDAR